MNNVRERKLNIRRDTQTLFAAILAFALVVAVGVVVFLRSYNSYIDGVLYQERLSQMKEVTTQLFTGLEDVVQNQWHDVNTFNNYVEQKQPRDGDGLLEFMQEQYLLNDMESAGERPVAVDTLGRYLTQEGWQGALAEMDLLLSGPERVSFVSKSMTSDRTNMYFLNRLPEPITIRDGERTTQIIYYGISKDMEQLNPYFVCEAYDGSNSVYVLDKQGVRLFRSSSSLIDGYNAYHVLENMEYLHGHSFEDAKTDLEQTGHGYANAVLNGEEYYYALYQMDHAEWTLLFLVPSAHVATNVVSMVNTTVRLVMTFAVLLTAVAAFVFIMIVHSQQKRVLEAERRNSERLSEALDIAERAERTARQASRAKSDFLANMSHDIRTPMNAIVGITRLMAHDKSDPAKIDSYIEKVQQSSQHLLSLINDVLDMSKIESGEVILNREPIDLADQIGQVESILRPQIEERQQHFTIYTHNITHEHLSGDAVRLRQIFINLLSNAVKYTPNGGSIRLDVEELHSEDDARARLLISVTDSGCGMTPEFMTHVFEPFTRAENSTTNRVQGTGLGMAITKNIVDIAGGTIRVKSKPGEGSCFTVDLPLRIDWDAKTELPIRRVLLITDEEMLITNVRAAFRETDVTLLAARSEAEADAILRQAPVDVVLLGSRLNGDRLAENLQRLREQTGKALLLFCCEYEEREQVAAITERGGVDGVLVRPFFLSNFARAIERTRSDAAADVPERMSVLNGKRFLCAEDNALNAEILQAVLDMNGASCVIYPDGQKLVEAFAAVKPGEFDAILMDVQMPVMNGLDATRAIRRSENPLGKTIPIIAMTANAFSEDVQSCLDAGMDAHVAKPLDIGALERALRNVGNFSGGGTIVCP